MTARHTSPLEALLVDDAFDGDVYPSEPMARHTRFRIGGAQVSEVHANFIVNTGDATARDVLELINLVKTKVYETYGIELQPEVRFLGFA